MSQRGGLSTRMRFVALMVVFRNGLALSHLHPVVSHVPAAVPSLAAALPNTKRDGGNNREDHHRARRLTLAATLAARCDGRKPRFSTCAAARATESCWIAARLISRQKALPRLLWPHTGNAIGARCVQLAQGVSWCQYFTPPEWARAHARACGGQVSKRAAHTRHARCTHTHTALHNTRGAYN